jgi:hypothetical protein
VANVILDILPTFTMDQYTNLGDSLPDGRQLEHLFDLPTLKSLDLAVRLSPLEAVVVSPPESEPGPRSRPGKRSLGCVPTVLSSLNVWSHVGGRRRDNREFS